MENVSLIVTNQEQKEAPIGLLNKKSAAVVLVCSILGASTIFFHFIEKWNWFDSFYFSVITMSTVGYGAIVPVTTLGKAGVIVLIFSGIGALAALVQIIASDAINKRSTVIEHDPDGTEKAKD